MKTLTLQECKDEVAKEKDLTGWPDRGKIPYDKWWIIESMLDEAAELYAQQFRSTPFVEYFKREGDGEFRIVVSNGSAYVHPMGRDGKTLDFKI